MKPFILNIDNKRTDNVYVLLTATSGLTQNLSGITQGVYTPIKKVKTISADVLDSGRLYFVVSKTKPKGVPTPKGNYYYGWIELSKELTDCDNKGNCQLWINLSNVDVTGLQLSISGIDTNGKSFSCGYMSGATETINNLGKLFPDAIVTTSTGQNKIVAPDIQQTGYSSFQPYLDNLISSSSTMTILSDTTSGFTTQTFNGKFQSGPIVVSLKDSDGNIFEIPKSGLTDDIIYRCDTGMIYYKGKLRPDNMNPSNLTGQTKQDCIVGNSLFRDIMLGLHEGYFAPGEHVNSCDFPSYETFKYGGNDYAKAVHDCSNSYGFPYADSNLKVLVTANVTTPITITVCDDITPTGYSNTKSTNNVPSCGEYSFAVGTGPGILFSNLGDVQVGSCVYNIDPISSSFHGFIPESSDWTPIYFSGKTTHILYRTEPKLDVMVGSALLDSNDNPAGVVWVSSPYGWNLSFPAGCHINPNGIPPVNEEIEDNKTLYQHIKYLMCKVIKKLKN